MKLEDSKEEALVASSASLDSFPGVERIVGAATIKSIKRRLTVDGSTAALLAVC